MPIFDGEMQFRNPRKPLILYFIAGFVPTLRERTDAETYGQVSFRNATLVPSEHNPEPCDRVAGKVPVSYAQFPRARRLQAVPRPVATQVAPKAHAAPKAAPAPMAQPSPAEQKGWGKA